MDFSKRYASLNEAQKEAVDTIEGPLMVVAGPGTGKTELLSVRTANILKKTDTLPENILCLTFTESGANAMRERLTSIIGKDAYKVAIHTFHSFGTEVINQNGEFFYQGANFRPSDELSTFEILRAIFEALDYRNVLAKKLNDDYTYLSDSATVISELKKSGLTSDELLHVLAINDGVIEKTEQLLTPVFAKKITKTTADEASECIEVIRSSGEDSSIPGIVSLSLLVSDSLESAVTTAQRDNSTKAITAWRNEWFKKNEVGVFVMKAKERQQKLRTLSSIYEQYLARMQEAELFDFDDMILTVVHAIEVFDELRFNLQEKYQYIMVDEFQDTNLAQMRIIRSLTDNIVVGDMPNVMVVGDDDQAIYSFQGADISNILNFTSLYPKAKQVTLIDNYRSTAKVLTAAREVIIQGNDRLENKFKELDKSLVAHSTISASQVNLLEAESINDERHWIVQDIKQKIASGTKAGEIAVLTRRHHEIVSLLPYFVTSGIAVNYERRDNVLELEPIVLLEKIAQILLLIADGQHDEVNGLLPQLLAHPMWTIKPESLWHLSLAAYEKRQSWLETMIVSPEFFPLYTWFVDTAMAATHSPLEYVLDLVIGKSIETNNDDEVSEIEDEDAFAEETESKLYISPFYSYYFSDSKLISKTDDYLTYLEGLRTIRTKLREYRPTEVPTLQTFIEFITLHRQLGSVISSVRKSTDDENAVNLMTAHKSKGLEFKDVYILNAVDNAWGEKVRSRSRLIGYPENLRLAPSGDTSDERLRLFYVAMTRAKQNLTISYSLQDEAGKHTLRASFLVGEDVTVTKIAHDPSIHDTIGAVELAWYQPLIAPTSQSLAELLKVTLSNYKLSVTHLNNFLDVTRGGPQTFLLHNLLRFPQALSPHAAYGSAIHAALQRAHAHMSANGEPQAVEDILHNFEASLAEKHLLQSDYETFLQKGSDTLQAFLAARYDSFTRSQKSELNFSGQHSMIGDAHLTGSLDLVDIYEQTKTMVVTDYKTGSAALSWSGKTEYEKIKLHKYRQQLIFYKLLVESSRDYHNYIVENGVLQFVEPTKQLQIIALETEFTHDEIERVQHLIEAVWNRIITLDLPDITEYEQSLKGIIAFEDALLDSSQ